MTDGNIVGTIDLAELAFWGFVVFFIMLVFWLRREDRREGYPTEDELTGMIHRPGGPLSTAAPKVFKLPFGRGTATAPHGNRDPFELKAKMLERFPGAPYVPTGNPLKDGIGPAGYAQRADWADQDAHGNPRIVPMATLEGFAIEALSTDPRGLPVYGADGAQAGTVSDVWVDRAESIIRYLEIETSGGKVLGPMAMAVVRKGRVTIDAINAADFAEVPKTANPTEVTRLEEEKVIGYFGGGYLYANRSRMEPLV